MSIENPNTESQEKFLAKETINGINISVGWDQGYMDYTIYLPQIEVGHPGIPDQVIRISEEAEDAKKVFEFAKNEAGNSEDVYDLYHKVENFISEEIW